MDDAFIIMQIGDAEIDRVCDDVFVPAIESAGLVSRRVDRDNEGGLLKAEIVDFLERSTIIVADLTNERPNCYLEVGYAMGLGKKKHLILTVREDHHHRSENYRPDGPRVHFDLEGYDLLLWSPEDLEGFREELEQRIKRRLAIVEAPAPGEPDKTPPRPRGPVPDEDWVNEQRERALDGIQTVDRSGFMEASVAIAPKGSWRQAVLLGAVEGAQIKTFGWPVGIVLNRDNLKPSPTSEGVRAEVPINTEGDLGRASYDYWYLRQTGDFYLLQSLFEDERRPNSLFFDTRIVRTTELLLFLSRLYARLDVPDSTLVHIELTHGGLAGRRLGAANQSRIVHERETREQTVTAVTECTVGELQTKLVEQVRALLEPVFMLFDFFELSDEIWDQIVNAFVDGRMA